MNAEIIKNYENILKKMKTAEHFSLYLNKETLEITFEGYDFDNMIGKIRQAKLDKTVEASDTRLKFARGAGANSKKVTSFVTCIYSGLNCDFSVESLIKMVEITIEKTKKMEI